MSSLSASDPVSQPVAPSSEETATAAPAAPAASAPAGTSTVEPRPAVRVENVSVTYRTTFERTPTFKQAIVRFGRGERAVREVHAVKDVSFDVPEGTSLGIIGANGAGKSTLIRTIGGILPPTSGRIEVHGRISALLALGVGFNPNLSGRENVVLGGLANGLTRAQVSARAEEIADFSEPRRLHGPADPDLLLRHALQGSPSPSRSTWTPTSS